MYVVCVDRPCKAKGIVRGQDFEIRGIHNHAAPVVRIKKLKLRKDIKSKAGQPGFRTNMRRAFDEACSSHDGAAEQVSFPTMQRTMYRMRKKNYPPTPSGLREYGEILSSGQWRHFGQTTSEPPQQFFFKYLLSVELDWEAVVFASPSLTAIMKTTERLHIDATFKVVPRSFGYQLMTVHVLFMDHMLPAIYILMTRKTEECYDGVIEYITTELCPESVATVKTVMSDYEAGLMNAVSAGWRNASVKGCFFHFAWAVYRKHQQLMMTHLTEANVIAKKALKSLMALALLPPGKMREGLQVVRQLVAQNQLQEQFHDLCQYVDEYWLTTVGPGRVSVYNEVHRTNNSVEGFYSKLLAKMGTHPGIWQFTDFLRKTEQCTSKDQARLGFGLDVSAPRRRRQNIQDNNIKKAWKFLLEGRYNVTDFLSKCAHAVDGLESRLRGVVPREAPAADAEDGDEPDQPLIQYTEEPNPQARQEDIQATIRQEDIAQIISDHSEAEEEEEPIMDGPAQELNNQLVGEQTDEPYYRWYHLEPIIHRPHVFLPEDVIIAQERGLSRALTIGPAEDPCFVADEGQIICCVCLTNSATRMAVPCGHMILCRDCLPGFATQKKFHTVTGAGGQIDTTPIREPVTCPNCRAIVGQLIPTYS